MFIQNEEDWRRFQKKKKKHLTDCFAIIGEIKLNKFQFQVQNAGCQLNTVASKLVEVEKNLGEGDGEVDNVVVMELLESMTEVKNEYQNLRKDIKEVQKLQKEMNTSLRQQMRVMTQTFAILKKKIELNVPPH